MANAGTPTTPGVEGVCRYDEAEVACWNRHGAPDTKLMSQVRAALSTLGSGSSLPVVVGRKGRIAVVLTPPVPRDDSLVWNVEAVHPAESSFNANLQRAPDGRSRSLVLLSEDARATTGALRFTERKRLPREVSIALRTGASASLGGCRLTISKVEKLDERDEDRIVFLDHPSWRVVILRSRRPPRDEEFFPVDPYAKYSFDNRRASLSPTGKIIFAPADAPRIGTIDYPGLPKGAVGVLLDRDPAKVKRLILGGNEVRTTTLGGVPLDPRS